MTQQLKAGDKVVMHTCIEAEANQGRIWTCKTDQFTRGKGVYAQDSVFLEGYSGSFAPEFLQKVNIDESRAEAAEQEREYKVERYLLTHPDHDPFQLRVINSVNLPNNPEFDDLIEEWLVNNYGNLDGWKYYCLSLTKMRTIGADTDATE